MSLTGQIGSILDSFPQTPILIERFAQGAFVKGRYVPGSKSHSIPCASVVHPSTGKDQELLPQGVRNRESVIVYTKEAIQTADQEAGTPADRLWINNRRYEVFNVEDWSINGGYFKSMAALEISAP